MKHVLPYSLFENQTAIQTLSKEQASWLDNCTKETWQLNPATGLVDVDGYFSCRDQGLRDFKGVRFGVIRGDFSCSDNQLTSLEGAPQKVGGGFYCNDNGLTSLEGAPREVGEDFSCYNNELTSLKGAPQKVRWNFYCGDNGLTSLEGAPREVGRNFNCGDNKLTSLEGAPQNVGWYFFCNDNPVSEKTLKSIFGIMETGKGYLEAVESIWTKIPVEDQALLYRPEFEWIGPDEVRKLDALRAYQGFKDMI